MNRARLAVLIAAFAMLADVGAALATAATPPVSGRLEFLDLSFAASFMLFAVVGAVIVARSGNAVGWLFLGAAAAYTGGVLLRACAILLLEQRPETGSLGLYLAWLSLLASPVAIALVFLLPLVFPDGHLPSPRWRAPAVIAAVTIGVQNLLSALEPGEMYTAGERPNPFGVAGLEGVADAAFLLVFAVLGIPVAALVSRARRARGVERQQLKWVMYTSVSLTVLFAGIAVFGVYELAIIIPIALAALPLSVAIAILRYRLYDIDVLINRTLVYAAVTGVLAATYFGAVVLIQAGLRPFTSGSELAVAGSTLLVVALFQPLRRRVRDFVDRRFYRSRYDAARTLDAFSARLRDQVELDAVREDLVGVVHEAIRPAHASVWLRR